MKKVANIFLRYSIALILGILLPVFYLIFTPLTTYPVYWLLSLFYPVVLSGSSLIMQTAKITLIPACIAGSAYYLLLILNLLTPIKLKTRLKALFFSFAALLLLNILRIIIFSLLFLQGFKYFDITHILFWYILSIVLVFLIWLAEIRLFRIKNIPAYSDIKYLLTSKTSVFDSYQKSKISEGLRKQKQKRGSKKRTRRTKRIKRGR